MSEPWSPRRRPSASESLGDSTADPSGAWAVGETVESLGYEPRPRPPVPRRTALIGVGVTLLVAVGGVVGWNLWQGRSADQDLFLALPQPVTETPALAWSWQADTEAQAAFVVGEVTLVEHGFDTLTALDTEGEELWTSSIAPDAFVTTAPGRDDLFVEASISRVALRSLEDGSELWADDGRLLRTGEEWVLLHGDDRIREVDLLSGRELWSAEASGTVGVDSTGVYAVENRRLTKWSHSGEQLWVAAEPETASTAFGQVVPAEGFVALGGEGVVTAYDTEDGKIVWTADLGGDDAQVGLFVPDLVYAYALNPSPEGSEAGAPARVIVLGVDGKVGSLEADSSFFYAYPIASGEEHYAVEGVTGRFYDSALEPVGEPLGQVIQLVEGGAYVQDDGDIVFVTPDGAQWRLAGGTGRLPQVAVGDRRLVLLANRVVRAYE